MRTFLILCAVISLFIGGVAAQDPPATTTNQLPRTAFMVRLQQMRVDSGGAYFDCLLVLPDGLYHREHRTQDLMKQLSGAPMPPAEREDESPTYVYEGKLNVDEIQGLGNILNTPEFKLLPAPLQSPKPPVNPTILYTVVVRDDGAKPQSLRFIWPKDKDTPEKLANPLRDWFNSMQKRKGDQVKRATRTFCAYPQQVIIGNRVWESPKQDSAPKARP